MEPDAAKCNLTERQKVESFIGVKAIGMMLAMHFEATRNPDGDKTAVDFQEFDNNHASNESIFRR